MKQISKNVYQISLGIVNVFVVEGDGLTLIDTGVKNSADKIFEAISKAGKKPEDIKRIILTHLHPDHAGSAAELKRRLNVPVMAHPLDAALMEQGFAGRKELKPIVGPGLMNWLIYNLFIIRADKTIEPIKADILLNDNDFVPGASGIKVIHTPGHSAGHIALLVQDEGVLIAADMCANSMGLALSTMYEDMELGKKSILKAVQYDFDKALFGHGNPLMGDAAQKMRAAFNN